MVAQYTDALRNITGSFTGTMSHQHREVQPGRIKQDKEDLDKCLHFLQHHNPFTVGVDDQLRNVSTGVIADSRVNVDDAIDIGQMINNKLTGQRYGDVVLKRADQATTFAVMRKPVKFKGDVDIHMSSAELFQRLFAMACSSGAPPDRDVFTYEMAAVAPALFMDDGSMRKTSKSTLANHILKEHPCIIIDNVGQAAVVVDGCAVLHQLPWPKVGCFQDICVSYVKHVTLLSHQGYPTYVVFDSYTSQTTKEPEQKRRRLARVRQQIL